MSVTPPSGLGQLLPGFGESLSPLPPATATAGQAITNALSTFGAAVRRQRSVLLTDAIIRSIAGGGATTLLDTLPGVTGAAIILISCFRLSSNVTAYSTPGATTPNWRFPNSDLPTTNIQTFTNHDNMASGKAAYRYSDLLVPSNLGSTTFTSPLLITGQPLTFNATNAGAAWTVGDPANFIHYVYEYLLYSPSLGRFI